MTFDELLVQGLELPQREKRRSYRALKVRFGLDDEHLEALKDETIFLESQGDNLDVLLTCFTHLEPLLHLLLLGRVGSPCPQVKGLVAQPPRIGHSVSSQTAED
jgi:hypothetical protein